MKTKLIRLILALAIILSAATGFAAALGLVAFAALRICGVDGAAWSSCGWLLLVLGCAIAAMFALDRLEGTTR